MKLTKEQEQEIKEQQNQETSTKRVTAPDLEKILYEAIPILDHGFIRVVDYMGNDTSIVQAARVSYGKGTKKVSTDSGLIKYLMRHWHSTPFEMCEIKYHVKLPIFIARQWIRHRTANVNEYSARYSILDKEFYLLKIIENIENNQIKWKYSNYYWVDPNDGVVWKSIQKIAPNVPEIKLEITKQPDL